MEKMEKLTIDDYKAVLDNVDDGIFIVDKKGTILYVNKAVEKNGEKNTDELIGRDIDELVQEGYCTEFVSKRVIQSGKAETSVQHTKDDKELLVTAKPYYKNGELQMVIACERDVTELACVKNSILKINSINKKYKEEIERLKAANATRSEIIAISANMKKVIDMASRVAKVDTTVLITGESGTGKEVLASFICKESLRKDKPFIKINCGAIPENLLESELFGYVDGAFTGARKQGKVGYFGMADNGTIFLDEISEMPYNLQVKLLRAIQEKEIMPVGSDTPTKLDIRIIAATNKDLKKLVSEGKFREDLYYRIGVVSIAIPPLRERKEDISILAVHFINKFNEKYNINKKISRKAYKYFLNYQWPGNIRELENMIESLAVTAEDDIISEHDVRTAFYDHPMLYEETKKFEMIGSLEEMVRAYEAEILMNNYERYRNTEKMAEVLGTTRSTINRKLAKYNIR